MRDKHNRHLGRVCVLPFLVSVAWAAQAAEDTSVQVVASERQEPEEVVVTEPRLETEIHTLELHEGVVKPMRRDG